MGPELIAIETDQAPPSRADVVIIGGGIAGVSTLLSLAEKGVSAVLVEKGRLAGEQSSRNWGFLPHAGTRPGGGAAGDRKPAPMGSHGRARRR
jgi:glycine/D-amino acid oxidase-like deaminating enzyme